MTMAVWKFPLAVEDGQHIDMPRGAKVLHVAAQNEQPCIWALCDTTAAKEPRLFATVGTGHSAPNEDEGRYLGSYMLRGGALVFHVFEPVT